MDEKITEKERELLENARKLIESASGTAKAIKDGYGFKCSSCEQALIVGGSYCPFCGKKLDWRFAHDTIGLEEHIIFGGVRYEVEEIALDTQMWPMTDELTITAKSLELPEEDET